MHVSAMSGEQISVIQYIQSGENVKVIAYPGCGKTTIALLAAHSSPPKTFLLLTYNRKLCDETNENIERWNLGNIVCLTYHAFAGRFVRPRVIVNNDTKLLNLVNEIEIEHCRVVHAPFDCIILDETQDMSEVYYRMLCAMLKPQSYQLMILGDPRQQVYDFLGADTKYLLHCEEYFRSFASSETWNAAALTISFRMTPNICDFVNAVWGIQVMSGNREKNPHVEYWYGYPFSDKIVKRIESVIEKHGEQNVAIISPCNAGREGKNDPTTHIINMLTASYNFHLNHESCSHENKVRVWTREGSKGSTIPVVIVMGFDARGGRQPNINKIGVAISRASHKLIVVHGSSYDRDIKRYVPHPYIFPLNAQLIRSMMSSDTLIAPYGIPGDNFLTDSKQQDFISVTDITHNSAMAVKYLLAHGTCECICSSKTPIKITTKRCFNRRGTELQQDLSPIIGTAIPFQVEFEMKNSISQVEAMLNPLVLPDSESPIDSIERLFEELESGRCTRSLHPHGGVHRLVLTRQEKGKIRRGIPGKPTWASILKWLKNHRAEIPSLQSYGFINKKRYDDIFNNNYLEDVKHRYFKRPLMPDDFMFLASASTAFEGSHHMYNQIGQDFTFIEHEAFAQAACYLRSVFDSDEVEFERVTSVALDPQVESHSKIYDQFLGRIDAVEYGNAVKLHEFKVVTDLTDEHRLQAMLYSALYCLENDVLNCSTLLTNAKTGEQLELSIDKESALLLVQEAAKTRM